MSPNVIREMLPYMTTQFANCHSQHKSGRLAAQAVEKARAQIADLINASSSNEVIFTSGATEAGNIAIKGVSRYQAENKGKDHIITSTIEHKCIQESVKQMEREGLTAHYVNVDKEGFVKLDELEDILKTFDGKVSLVSIIGANNEVGVVQDLQKIGQIAHQHNAYFHSDCAQLIGKKPVDVQKLGLDLMGMSGHKMYGPKGVGALYINKKAHVHIKPIISGGGQENNVRSGTLPVFLCVGMGQAAEDLKVDLYKDMKHYEELWKTAVESLQELPKVYINGPKDKNKRIMNNLNVSFLGVEGESLLLACDDQVAFSTGSACASQSLSPSHVLSAMQIQPELIHSAIRLSWNKWTKKEDVKQAMEKIKSEVKRLREISVLWED